MSTRCKLQNTAIYTWPAPKSRLSLGRRLLSFNSLVAQSARTKYHTCDLRKVTGSWGPASLAEIASRSSGLVPESSCSTWMLTNAHEGRLPKTSPRAPRPALAVWGEADAPGLPRFVLPLAGILRKATIHPILSHSASIHVLLRICYIGSNSPPCPRLSPNPESTCPSLAPGGWWDFKSECASSK